MLNFVKQKYSFDKDRTIGDFAEAIQTFHLCSFYVGMFYFSSDSLLFRYTGECGIAFYLLNKNLETDWIYVTDMNYVKGCFSYCVSFPGLCT